jgi:3-oxoacyl-[acyl-carrier protein] reductase
VADIQAVAAAFRQIGHVDNLVCNAGIWKGGLVQDISETDWDRLFDVNVKGVYNCIKAALPSFLNHHSGSIVTVSSMWGQVGASCESAYAATKGAVIALTKSLAKELGPSGIRVNCVAPGVILTDMCAGYSEEDLQALANETPLGRNGQPEDVAKAIAFLLEAEFITGHVLNVDGGFVI